MRWIKSKEHIDAEAEHRLKEQTVGQRIRFIRGGRTREYVAERYEISVSQLKRYELGKGKPPFDFLSRFWHREGLSSSWLEYGEGPIYDFQVQAAARYTQDREQMMNIAGSLLSTIIDTESDVAGMKRKMEGLVDSAARLQVLLQQFLTQRTDC